MIEDKLFYVLSKVFDVPIEAINEYSTVDTIKNWDSLTHVLLIAAIELNWGILVSPDDAWQIDSVAKIRDVLEAANG